MGRQAILLLTLSAFTAAGGQLLLKVGAQGRDDLIGFFNPYVIVGLILYVFSTLVWIYVLSFEKLTNVYAFTALTFVLVYLGAVMLLGEKISVPTVAGIVAILFGLYLISQYNSLATFFTCAD
jgi:drug/metabolite transporter (DMT)-like permease